MSVQCVKPEDSQPDVPDGKDERDKPETRSSGPDSREGEVTFQKARGAARAAPVGT